SSEIGFGKPQDVGKKPDRTEAHADVSRRFGARKSLGDGGGGFQFPEKERTGDRENDSGQERGEKKRHVTVEKEEPRNSGPKREEERRWRLLTRRRIYPASAGSVCRAGETS